VTANSQVIHVDAFEESSIAAGLLEALDQGTSDVDRESRRKSVAELTWRQTALDHVAGWQ
jgi:hypothetical protein